MLRVILSAYACEPGRGSEPGVGWNIARELSSRVSLRVVTRSNNRGPIENSSEEWIKNVEWIYWDPPRWASFWKKGERGVQLYYLMWQWGLKSVIRQSLKICDADIIHHLTFGKFWIPSPLADLERPFVFGPVGGGERTPPGLLLDMTIRGRISEMFRSLVIWMACLLPIHRDLLSKAAWTYAATPQTKDRLNKLGVQQISTMAQSAIEQMATLKKTNIEARSADDPLVFVTASRLIPWKAVDLAIEALAHARTQHDVKMVILQKGPELKRLKDLTQKLALDDCVEFKGKLENLDAVYDEIINSDALLHPALHEAFGQSCLEALALGTPVICLNWGGPGMIVDDSSGLRVTPSDRQTTIRLYAEAMLSIRRKKLTKTITSESCKARAHENFSWTRMADSFVKKYHEIIDHQNSNQSP